VTVVDDGSGSGNGGSGESGGEPGNDDGDPKPVDTTFLLQGTWGGTITSTTGHTRELYGLIRNNGLSVFVTNYDQVYHGSFVGRDDTFTGEMDGLVEDFASSYEFLGGLHRIEIYLDGTFKAGDRIQADFTSTDGDAGTLTLFYYQQTEPHRLDNLWPLQAGIGEWSNGEPDKYFVFAKFIDSGSYAALDLFHYMVEGFYAISELCTLEGQIYASAGVQQFYSGNVFADPEVCSWGERFTIYAFHYRDSLVFGLWNGDHGFGEIFKPFVRDG
jgi:hypothetical protein